MKKILLVYVPFCTPASPPYSLTHLYSFLKNNCENEISVLDLNLEFHKLKFLSYQKYFQEKNWADYDKTTKEYHILTKKCYSENNKKVVNDGKPEFFDELLKKIEDQKPDIVAFSVVYSSQAFYAYALLKELKNYITIVGGPSVNTKLIQLSDKHLKNEIELLEYVKDQKIEHTGLNFESILDFSIYSLSDYFTPKPVIPLKTCSTCYYKKCTFCAHFAKVPYQEFNLDDIKKTIIKSKQKYFFLIDDMIHLNRLLKLAVIFKELGVKWACQLRPTKEWNYDVLQKLKSSGLIFILWGVESGNNRILNLMQKGTNVKDVEIVLENSHKAGIKNITYIMFGFPGELESEFLDTIIFLEQNSEFIDLVSVSVFGLQRGTVIYENLELFGIKELVEEERTVLEPKISYELTAGLSKNNVIKLKRKYGKRIEQINKYPNNMNFFREHTFFN